MATRLSIYLNFQKANAQADELIKCADELRRVNTEFTSSADELKTAWEGNAANTYFGKCGQLSGRITNSAKDLDRIASVIKRTAKAYYDAEMKALEIASERDS